MRKTIFIALPLFLLALNCTAAFAQSYNLSGTVIDKATGRPVEFATVVLPGRELWAVANEKGEFVIKNVPKGESDVEISCLGYVDSKFKVDLTGVMGEGK